MLAYSLKGWRKEQIDNRDLPLMFRSTGNQEISLMDGS